MLIEGVINLYKLLLENGHYCFGRKEHPDHQGHKTQNQGFAKSFAPAICNLTFVYLLCSKFFNFTPLCCFIGGLLGASWAHLPGKESGGCGQFYAMP